MRAARKALAALPPCLAAPRLVVLQLLAVAALAVGARFSSASIRAGGTRSGRVHAIRGGGGAGRVFGPHLLAASAPAL